MIHKLGHYGFVVARWDEEVKWYTDTFNFVPSDVQWLPGNEDLDVITFMHLDLGDKYSDHHTLFLARARPDERDRMHHTSYEVEDFDTQLLGHQWLAKKGHKSVWGVGRHILGSQIFDYWRDPSGFTIEHYADGDLVNIKTGTKRSEAGPLAVWGPEMPVDMTEDGPQPTPA
jgi:catechol 2,3-dioxygenase-like lactoylglutathione lyase family enzyme